ncbi:DUF6304 family protein [Streptomyces sp. NPDC050738]|uniref:DUF6304 family protein n=1 Tax=Streptomyces sp. NPDC050738 TaxID=3154744 RepID=UPI0034187357
MTAQSWAGWYRDRHGSEAFVITVEGRQLHTSIRGVEYVGDSFDALAPARDISAAAGDGALGDCVLEWDMPLPVLSTGGEVHQATLSCLLALRRPDTDLGVTLHSGGARYSAGNNDGDFGAALALIQEQLPPGSSLQAPFTVNV